MPANKSRISIAFGNYKMGKNVTSKEMISDKIIGYL